MKKILLSVILQMFVSGSLFAQDCKVHKIYCRIMEFSSSIDKDKAFLLSNLINDEAKKSGIDPMLAVAILMQENRFESRNSFHEVKKTEKKCDVKGCYELITIKRSVTDMGIAQININTAKNYKLDYERLFNLDTEYAIRSYFIVLKDKMKTCSNLGPDSWTCYHSINEPYRIIYKDLVMRYYK